MINNATPASFIPSETLSSKLDALTLTNTDVSFAAHYHAI
jgi:hypothetical protein